MILKFSLITLTNKKNLPTWTKANKAERFHVAYITSSAE